MHKDDYRHKIGQGDKKYLLPVFIDSTLPKSDQMWLSIPTDVTLPDGRTVSIPAGFITDCHSTPPILAAILPEYDNRTNIAAIVHDYLYIHWEDFIGQNPALEKFLESGEMTPRQYADWAYGALLYQFNPKGWRNPVYYYAVRLFGSINWFSFREINKKQNVEAKSESAN